MLSITFMFIYIIMHISHVGMTNIYKAFSTMHNQRFQIRITRLKVFQENVTFSHILCQKNSYKTIFAENIIVIIQIYL